MLPMLILKGHGGSKHMKGKENRVNMWMTVFCLSIFLCAGCGKSPAEEEITESTEIKQENSGENQIEQGGQDPQEIQKQQKIQDQELDTETAPADVTGEESMQAECLLCLCRY